MNKDEMALAFNRALAAVPQNQADFDDAPSVPRARIVLRKSQLALFSRAPTNPPEQLHAAPPPAAPIASTTEAPAGPKVTLRTRAGVAGAVADTKVPKDPARAEARRRSRELVEAARTQPWSRVEEVPGVRKVEHRRVRLFFPTPAGFPPQPPIDTVEQRVWDWSPDRKVKGPGGRYHSEGPGWMPRAGAKILHPDGQWRSTDYLVQLTVVNEAGQRRTLTGHRLDGHHVAEVPCNEKCTEARGHKCECSCGGANHGAGTAASIVKYVPHTSGEIEAALRDLGLLT